jgi:hypothetical protein
VVHCAADPARSGLGSPRRPTSTDRRARAGWCAPRAAWHHVSTLGVRRHRSARGRHQKRRADGVRWRLRGARRPRSRPRRSAGGARPERRPTITRLGLLTTDAASARSARVTIRGLARLGAMPGVPPAAVRRHAGGLRSGRSRRSRARPSGAARRHHHILAGGATFERCAKRCRVRRPLPHDAGGGRTARGARRSRRRMAYLRSAAPMRCTSRGEPVHLLLATDADRDRANGRCS